MESSGLRRKSAAVASAQIRFSTHVSYATRKTREAAAGRTRTKTADSIRPISIFLRLLGVDIHELGSVWQLFKIGFRFLDINDSCPRTLNRSQRDEDSCPKKREIVRRAAKILVQKY